LQHFLDSFPKSLAVQITAANQFLHHDDYFKTHFNPIAADNL